MAIDVGDLESPQPVVGIADRGPERGAASSELRRQRIGFGDADKGIPARRRVANGIGQWFGLDRLEHQHRPAAPHQREKRVIRRGQVDHVEPQH